MYYLGIGNSKEDSKHKHFFHHMSTLNMLSCFKVYVRYIQILNHVFKLIGLKKMKLILEQQYTLFVPHSQ